MDSTAWKEHEDIQESYWWHRHKRDFLLHLAEQEPYARVLEIGSGGGILAERLKLPGHRVTTDLSSRHVRKGGVAARLPDLCFKNETFDLVFLSEVIEHIADPVKALQSIHRVMRPGARCLVTVPAWPFLWSDHDIFYGHQKRYTLPILRGELLAAGFQIRRLGWAFFMPLWAAAARHFLSVVRRRIFPNAPPRSGFVPLPDFFNETCYQYLRRIEQPLTFRWLMPVGLTIAAVAVKE